MAEINLKTLTPDTSLPTAGFLFGADSQATTDPSVYSTQTVATTLLGSTSLTGDTLTADAPVLNLTQTWNNAAVTFTGMKFNAAGTSDANSASASLLMDLQVNGTSKFKVDKASNVYNVAEIYKGNTQAGIAILLDDVGNGMTFFGSTTRIFSATSVSSPGIRIGSTFGLGWSSNTDTRNAYDALITRKGAANLRFGEADAASPVAQTLSVQSIVAGQTNASAAAYPLTINGSQGTGSGAGGSIVFQVAPANTGGGATVQNTLATAMVIDSVKTVRLGTGYTVATLPAAGTAGRRTYVTDALAPVYLGTLTGGGAVVCPVFDNGTAWVSA